MANRTQTIRINSVLGGHAPTTHFNSQDQFRTSLGIDPAQPIDDADAVTSTLGSGLIRPAGSEKFTGTDITAAPLWLVPNPKDALVYVYDARGSIYTLDAAFTGATGLKDLNDTAADEPVGALGNGLAYYDNYIYASRSTTVARYGPLDGTPSWTTAFWTSTLSLAALENTTYPTSFKNNLQYPNHFLHRNPNGRLYIADVQSNKGNIHYVETTKTTVEGDTNNASTFGNLDLGFGLWPTALETFGSDLAIAMYEGNEGALRQRRAKLAFWDKTSLSINKSVFVEYPDQIITAMKNVNGVLYVVSGNIDSQGFRVTRFLGGYTFEEVWYSEVGEPCLPGAIDGVLNQFLIGTYTTIPESDGCVFSKGLQKNILGRGCFNTMRCTGGDSSTSVSSLLVADNNSFGFSVPIIGWTQAGEGSTSVSHGIDKQGATYNNAPSVWWSALNRIGARFKITRIRIPFAQAVAANMILTAKVYVDNGLSSTTLATVNNTNYPNGERFVTFRPDGLTGDNNFWLELRWTGSALLTVELPIEIDFEVIPE